MRLDDCELKSPSEKASVLLVPDIALYLSARLPKIFHHAGSAVEILCPPGNPLAWSGYAHRVLREPGMRAVAARVLEELRGGRYRAVVVADEPLVHHLLAQGDAALFSAWQPGAREPTARAFLRDKRGLEPAREQWGLSIPPTRVCRTLDDVADFARQISWPLILKTPHSTGGRGVWQVDNLRQAAECGIPFPCVAQQFICGRMGVAEMLCSRGRPLAWLASHGTKHTRGRFGPSTAKLFRAMPELAPLVEQVAARTRFEGFCGFDWIEEEGTGRFYLIEFHPRPTSGLRFGAACGIDFSTAVRAWLDGAGENFPTQTQPAGAEIAGLIFPYDLIRVAREKDWRGMLAWLPGTGVCRDILWDDPAQIFGLVVYHSRNKWRTVTASGSRAGEPSFEAIG